MIKIFIHQISYAGPGYSDCDEEFYCHVEHEIKIYSNIERLDFSDLKYSDTIVELKNRINKFHGPEKHRGYIGDFDENDYREKSLDFLAKEICDKLNKVTGDKCFEPFYLNPYKTTQCRSWDRNYYWDPQNSECFFNVTSSFLGFPMNKILK
jgi:hypothetical protein